MAWKQIKDANMNTGYTGGWCLKFVQDAYGTDHLYPDATAAWNAEPNKHYDLPPKGKTVPVYFSLGNVPQGHVAISLDDGMVASSTQSGYHAKPYFHPNLQDLINIYGRYNGGCTYLGWGEYVGSTRVVAPDVVYATIDQVRQAYLDILERPADAGGLAHYQSYTNDFVRTDLFASQERKNLEQAKANALLAQQQADAKAKADALAAAELAKQKVVQDALAKEAQVLSDHSFIERVKALIQKIIDFFASLKG